MSKFFSKEELACPCCGQMNMPENIQIKFDEIRVEYGLPIKPNSACRCHKHNAEVHGAKDSAHLYGLAMDIPCPENVHRFKLLRAVMKTEPWFVEVHQRFIHVDFRPRAAQSFSLKLG